MRPALRKIVLAGTISEDNQILFLNKKPPRRFFVFVWGAKISFMKKEYWGILGIVVLVGILLNFNYGPQKIENEGRFSHNNLKILKVGEKNISIEMADTDQKRTLGLSYLKKLPENSGMLFIFEKEGYYPFWMKDMNFPIDIIWIDKEKKIVYFENNASPESFPKFFYAQKDGVPILSLYVLEVPAGFLVENNIKIGDSIDF